MSETLYPHEVVAKWLNNNVFKIVSSLLFIMCGIYCSNGIITMQPLEIIMGCVIYIFGWFAYNEQYGVFNNGRTNL